MDLEIYKNIIRYLAGETSEDEVPALKKWISESTQNQELFKKAEQLWLNSRPEEPKIPDINESWLELESKIKESVQGNSIKLLPLITKSNPSQRAHRNRILAIAAAFLLVAMTGIIFQQLFFSGNRQTVETSNAQRMHVTLPDGSLVTLRHASKIVFPTDFSPVSRTVQLTGEAFFEIVTNARPFVVTTENATIKVLGTKFNVWGRNQETRVFVSEGRVSLQGEQQEVILRQNQSSICRKNSPPAPAKSVDAQSLLGWRQGKLIFDQTTLREVVSELIRTYDVNIEIRSSGISDLTLTGTFNTQPLETILESIRLTLNLVYFQEGPKIVLAKQAPNRIRP